MVASLSINSLIERNLRYIAINTHMDTVVGTRGGAVGRGTTLQAGRSRVRWRSQWPCGIRRGSAAARLLGSWVRIPPGAWMFVLCLL
jgi:hypothetical protein